MDKNTKSETVPHTQQKSDHPVMMSNSRVILAADAVLAALEVSLNDLVERDFWAVERMKKAALEAALVSIVTP